MLKDGGETLKKLLVTFWRICKPIAGLYVKVFIETWDTGGLVFFTCYIWTQQPFVSLVFAALVMLRGYQHYLQGHVSGLKEYHTQWLKDFGEQSTKKETKFQDALGVIEPQSSKN